MYNLLFQFWPVRLDVEYHIFDAIGLSSCCFRIMHHIVATCGRRRLVLILFIVIIFQNSINTNLYINQCLHEIKRAKFDCSCFCHWMSLNSNALNMSPPRNASKIQNDTDSYQCEWKLSHFEFRVVYNYKSLY